MALKDFFADKQIGPKKFSEITGVSLVHVYRILKDPGYNMNLDTIRKIYNGTLKEYGEGLEVWEYMSH